MVDDLSDTGLTLNKSIEWLKNYQPIKNQIQELKLLVYGRKNHLNLHQTFCPIKLNNDPWIVQPTEHYEEMSIDEVIEKQSRARD